MSVPKHVVALSFLVVLLCFGCTTTSVSRPEDDSLSYPSNVYVWLSGPYSTQERMVREAIISVARSMHVKQALALDSRLVTLYRSDKGLQSFAMDESAFFGDTAMAGTISQLEIFDIHFDPGAGAVMVMKNTQEDQEARVYESEYSQEGNAS